MTWEFIDEEPSSTSVKDKISPIAEGIQRNIARTGSNIVTRGVGFAGDIFSLINEYAARPLTESITGKEGLPYEQTFLGKAIPTTETHRKGLESVTGEYLKPQNEIERFADDVVDTTQLLFTPGGQITRSGRTISGGQKLYRNFAKALGAEVLAKGSEGFTGDESAKGWTRMGSIFVTSLLDKPTAARQIGNLYRNAEASIPQGVTTNAGSLQTSMNSLVHTITRGRPHGNLSPPERFVVNQAENVLNLIQNGRIPVDQAWAQLRTINQELQGVLPDISRQQRRGIRTQAARINGALNETLENYGRTNPGFAQNFHPAQEATATLHQSQWIGNWIRNNIVSPVQTEGLLQALGVPIAQTTSKIVAPYKAAQLIYRISRSPTLRNLYLRTLNSASQENISTFTRHLNELDKKTQEDEDKDKWEFID